MNVGRVIGHLYCTIKDQHLTGQRILCIEPLGGREKPFWALDAIGVGAGETVLYSTGREASYAFLPEIVPCNAAVVGVVDELREQEQ
jgi:ethanolamine utilization protein EutN